MGGGRVAPYIYVSITHHHHHMTQYVYIYIYGERKRDKLIIFESLIYVIGAKIEISWLYIDLYTVNSRV